jgi:hypothetical protein
MTQDTGADSRMPAEIDGKQVVSAFRRMPAYGSTAYTYIVIVDEAAIDAIDGMRMYTVGVAFYSRPSGAWVLEETRADMPMAAAMREFARMAHHAANQARGGSDPL